MIGSEQGGGPRRYVIIHGHFYQPPRENPWLNIIERQASAAPYHDWNECVYDQCYRPNAFSRLLDPKGMIVDIHDNYANLSFNFGPTLFRWLEDRHPKIAQRIIEADRESLRRLGGRGNAIGQVYNHLIMPLSSRRDQLTQIRWAKDFFRKRFDRDLEGMWLAETAINMETVRCLVEEGVKFVVLSPAQAEAFKPISGNDWRYTSHQPLDTRRPYRIFPQTSDGKAMEGHVDVFFFDEALSRETSFGSLLSDARLFGSKIQSLFDSHAREDSVVVIATDGETFGHHKPLSDMCLSYFFKKTAPEMNVIPVNFAYYLNLHPPTFEVRLKNAFGEGTSWSCAHGVGRWVRDCGCKTGGQPSWGQAWRGPLRSAFQGLQKHVDAEFEKKLSPLFVDPWKLRDAYFEIEEAGTFDEKKEVLTRLGAKTPLSREQVRLVCRLIEAQKYMLFAFTSCGWFFSDVSGIETVQNILYAARAMQLGIDKDERLKIGEEFLVMLGAAKSNNPPVTAKTLFENYAVPNMQHLEIIAFTAVAERMIIHEDRSRSMTFPYYEYHVGLSHIRSLQSVGHTLYDVYSVTMEHKNFVERAMFYVMLHQNKEAEISGWVLPADAVLDPSATLSGPESWSAHKDALCLDLSKIFEEHKALAAKHFLDQLAKDTHHKYLAWMDRNEKIIASLCGLNFPIPEYVVAPITYVISGEWNKAVNGLEVYGQEDAVYNRLLSLWKKALKYNISIDLSESRRLLELLLSAELTIFAASLSFAACERMRYLMNIVDKFNIPIAKNKIEDGFHAILTGAVRMLYEDYKKNPAPDPKDREKLINLLNFARRMNFNTDDFRMN
jgi:alpha-amylase/alpha-mannosidase (GH57 family)